MMKTLKLSTLLAISGAGVFLLGAVIFGTIFYAEQVLKSDVSEVLLHDVEVMDRAHRLKLSVVQVQQWLTDISATRGQDGLNDGFDEAQANAQAFEELLVELQRIDPAAAAEYDAMRPAFAAYYSVGREMAQAYIDQGPPGGNAMMARFDEAAEALANRIDPFVERAREAVAQGEMRTTETLGLLNGSTQVGIALFILVLIGLGLVFRRVLRQVGRDPAELEALAGRIADGDLSRSSDEHPASATGVYAALIGMRDRLQTLVNEINEAANENGRMRAALDNASSAITVSDAGNRVIYFNASARALLDGLQPLLRRQQPDLDLDELSDRLWHCFADPATRGALTSELHRPQTVTAEIDDRTLRLVSSPVLDDQGYQGRITEWTDITEELAQRAEAEQRLQDERRVAAENQRIRFALDHVASGVTLADAGHRVIYVNEAARELFAAAASDMAAEVQGFDPEQLLQQPVDVLTARAGLSAQGLLALQSPSRHDLTIGAHHLRMVATPVVDGEGTHLGTALEWADRTVEVGIEQEIQTLVTAARNGDLGQRIAEQGKAGFHRQLAEGFNALVGDLAHMVDDIGRTFRGLASGDLSAYIDKDYAGAFGGLKDDVNTTLDRLKEIVGELRSAAEDTHRTAEEIADGNESLSARSEQQASSLEETAASMKEMTDSVRSNADNAGQANLLAANARDTAEKGGGVVAQAVAAMQRISESSGRIAEIIGVIDEIAFQTNLLALNASVEAARAGEQGRGFAVVATEVRNLASRSAGAAREIKQLINDSVDKVGAGTELVNQSGEVLREIVDGVKKVGDIVAEISAASSEQSAGIDQVNQAVASIDDLTQRNAALAQQTAQASSALKERAGAMLQRMAFFR